MQQSSYGSLGNYSLPAQPSPYVQFDHKINILETPEREQMIQEKLWRTRRSISQEGMLVTEEEKEGKAAV